MKKILYFIVLVFVFGACSEDEYDMPANLTADDVALQIVATDVLNEYTLINNTAETTAVWDMGNGVSENGNEVTAQYTFSGTYTISATIISQGGTVIVQQDLVISEDNPAFLSGYPYDELIGSGEQTWAMDAYSEGHFGLGPLSNPTEWYSAGVNAKAGLGLYDDRFTFSITSSGLTVTQETNGDVYANGSWASELGTIAGNEEPDGGDYIMPFDGGDYVCTVSGDNLIVNGGGFLGYYAGASEYQILTLTDDLLEVMFYDTKADFYWFSRFTPVDKLTPEPDPVVKELESNDIFDDFEGEGNIAWTVDATGFDMIDNFAPSDVNSSATIARYQKGAGVWENVSTELDYILDLSTRNIFTMKVFIPNFNDYVTECDSDNTNWLSDHNLKPQVEVKLQDATLGGNAYTTQVSVINTISEADFGTWVDLTFDFSGSSDRTDFDQIVVQLGAEGHCNTGTFYIDDFMLSE